VNETRKDLLKEIQDRLFTIGSHLAMDYEVSKKQLPDLLPTDVTRLEAEMDAMDATLPELRHFILPGGHQSVSFAHLARTVCRRAERMIVELNAEEEVEDHIIIYMNRLSDFLFVLSRKMALDLGIDEVKWFPRVS
jgi:cob(I)alamin adenosyltransferase